MSNLKLPVMSYANLRNLINDRGTWQKIAYETYAKYDALPGSKWGTVSVRHHASTIATITPAAVTLDNHGFNSKTTAMRLNAIARANDTDVWVGIKNYSMVARDADGKIVSDMIGAVTFARHARHGAA